MSIFSMRAAAPLIIALATLSPVAPVQAQDNVISAGKAAGQIGEQADGYIGIKGTVSSELRAAVDALNIKRRAAYTDMAAKRADATVADLAAATGCQILKSRVPQGQIYRLTGGEWQVKGADPIKLPDYCGVAGN